MIYLAQSYTGREHNSYHDAIDISKEIMNRGYTLYSPIMHSHVVSLVMDPQSHCFWMEQCVEFLRFAKVMIVYGDCSGSEGVEQEIRFCKNNNISIVYWKEGIDPELTFRHIDGIYKTRKDESNG